MTATDENRIALSDNDRRLKELGVAQARIQKAIKEVHRQVAVSTDHNSLYSGLAYEGGMMNRDWLQEIVDEYYRARAKHERLHSAHEGYAVILEELEELWSEIKARNPDRGKMQKEAVQVAAMALTFLADL